MNQAPSDACDEMRLNRYLDDDLNPEERQYMAEHLQKCRHCRHCRETLESFSKRARSRIEMAGRRVDFTALEKRVLTEVLQSRHRNNGLSRFMARLKYVVPATVAAGLLIFFVYSQYWMRPEPVPSAIINSFTGSMSSVMIFETPETHQTVLWYNEAPDVENDQDAV
ncbi:MAG: hypothetical protein CSA23_07145 [Deltaproteobacteria bacterium]|nr:MAG: hypothetical protein CSA23_07145 [Deltaproteobacteria bacterium]